jgi:hypothetical protein
VKAVNHVLQMLHRPVSLFYPRCLQQYPFLYVFGSLALVKSRVEVLYETVYFMRHLCYQVPHVTLLDTTGGVWWWWWWCRGGGGGGGVGGGHLSGRLWRNTEQPEDCLTTAICST